MNIDLGCGCEIWHGNILLSLLSDKQGGYEDQIEAIVHWWSNGFTLNCGKREESREKWKNMEESEKNVKNLEKWREGWTKLTKNG